MALGAWPQSYDRLGQCAASSRQKRFGQAFQNRHACLRAMRSANLEEKGVVEAALIRQCWQLHADNLVPLEALLLVEAWRVIAHESTMIWVLPMFDWPADRANEPMQGRHGTACRRKSAYDPLKSH